MTTENNEEQKELITFDLTNETDIKELNETILNTSEYFKLEEDITYKIELTSSVIEQVEKIFDDKTTTKHILQIKSINSNKEEYVGPWEVGSSVLKCIAKEYEKGATFKVTRTGNGQKTRYAVLKDF